MAALEALYAGLAAPGGLVMPCLEPVMTIDLGVDDEAVISGRRVSSPFRGPKTLVSNVYSLAITK